MLIKTWTVKISINKSVLKCCNLYVHKNLQYNIKFA
jgi:hypothetical protein